MRRSKENSNVRMAQAQYTAFRHTYMDKKEYEDPFEIARGPGYIDPKVAPTKRPISLYKCDSHVPFHQRLSLSSVDRVTSLHLVVPIPTDAKYNVDHGISYDSKHKGNAAPLKSATPRFAESARSFPGPGSYKSEQFRGAFPTLLKTITPRDARREHMEKKLQLQGLMGVVAPPNVSGAPEKDHAMPTRPTRKASLHHSTGKRIEGHPLEEGLKSASVCSMPNSVVCSSPLIARLTPKNAYNGSFVKVMASPRYRFAMSPGNRTQYVADASTEPASAPSIAVMVVPTSHDVAATDAPPPMPTMDSTNPAEPQPSNQPTLSLTSEVVKQEIALSDHVMTVPDGDPV
ncbi:Aste57867_23260 [Aphanomyces stellatus]|uniref:Aste57867_23260 protein n=1 Tax=Aphanomyces stellatus TaxID=120398 RepID=A0A485LP41_9STRA|nr:hypothetical protein As57867_023189 [Aphanomyces stellatus]VFT99905.1 Aste57867_23260 [Aphanomyces stellatus]